MPTVPLPRPPRRSVPALLATALLALPALGAAQPAASIVDLSLEQLSNVEVSSVSRRPQRLADVAGSVYIIGRDEIRRSGAVTLPEVLRLAPNLQVARADASQYAITARGFGSVLANKMLVLVDGRTVYSPLFSGVFWEARDLMLEDVERIEVLSGSGGTLYGTNAVNGVINIITRSAAETQGTLVAAGAGNAERLLAARHGLERGDTAVRLYARQVRVEPTEMADGTPIRDATRFSRAGFRADRSERSLRLTLQGDVYHNRIDQAAGARQVSGWNLLARASGEWAGGQARLQLYHDRSEREQPGAIDDTLDTWDIEFDHLSQPRAGHQLLWGAGWRHLDERLVNLNPAAFRLLPTELRQQLWHLFVQDEFLVAERVRLTLGVKAEHNDYTGLEWLPNARLAWEFAPEHLLWAAASRAVRAPARVDRDFFSPTIAGGPGFRSEVAQVYEVGLRGQPRPRVSWSATLFHHRFDRLRSLDAGPGGLTVNNNYEAELSGLESWGQWRVTDRWRLGAGSAWQRMRIHARPGTSPVLPPSSLGNDPRWRVTLSSAWDITPSMELDVHLRSVGKLPEPPVPAYTAVDVRWGWRPRPELELSLAVRNLTDRRHPEWGSPPNRAELARSVFLKAVWQY